MHGTGNGTMTGYGRSYGYGQIVVGAVCAVAAMTAAPAQAAPDARIAKEAIGKVLDASAAAWSAGDLDRFMQSYAPDAQTLYVSGSHTVHGYDAIRALYAARFGGGDRLAMGELGIEIVDFRLLGADHAFVLGRFHLHRDAAHGGDAQGPTTLVFARGPQGWRIIADHS